MSFVFQDRKKPPHWHEYKTRHRHPLLTPFHYFSWAADWAAYSLAKWPLVELLEYLGSFSILFAVIFYFAGSSDRTKQKHYQAWQVINTAQGKGGNGGRIDALQELNADGIALIGVDVSNAYLQGVKLERARIRRANFSDTDLRGADFKDAHLEDAEFLWANLRDGDLTGADLTGADFTNADLTGANLKGATLARASFPSADLSRVDLERVTDWESIVVISNANIFGIRNAPAGFLEWARKHGAIESNEDPVVINKAGN